MKSIRTYLIVVTSLLLSALILGVVVWYLYQNLDGAQPYTLPLQEVESGTPPEEVSESPVSEESKTLGADSLSPKQQEMLAAFGLQDAQVTLTPERIACAETSLGVARLEEVVNGSAPTPFEALELLACMKK